MNSEVPLRRDRIVKAAKQSVRLLILALVGVGIWHTVRNAIGELQAKQFALHQVRWGWLAASGVVYLAATAPCWIFWHRTLEAMGQRPLWLASLRAYYTGHLGKYLPGKALVVVIRSGMIRSPRVDTSVAVTAVFVETLTMMAVGAFTAAAILGVLYRNQVWLVLLSIGLMIGIGGPTVPPVFRRLVRMVGVKKVNPDIDRALAGLDSRLMLFGWVINVAGWGLMGLSLWLTLRAIPTTTIRPVELQDWPSLTACAALSVVLGFLSMLPGGLGVREYVVMTLLSGPFGLGAATVCAVLSRLVGLLAESVLAAVLYPLKRISGDGGGDGTVAGAA
ncbi:MAG: flippase-like domain-containing protein [Candidatus Anammoximicrobium sp.]|nr:flippase-like domain-containing protein [Candidatus Anammoximicrobium sp.]